LDNNVVSSIVRDDNASESDALSRLLEAHEQSKVELVTSELTLEEIKAAPKQYRPPLERTFRLLQKVPLATWDTLVGMNTFRSGGNAIISPMFANDPLYAALLSLGLAVADARHMFVAAKQGCHTFLTSDNSPSTGILRRASYIQAHAGLVVQRPSDLVRSEGW